MFKNKLANYESYSKADNGFDLEQSYSCYEVFIELSRDKEGNVMKNKDGSDRYHAIDDSSITVLDKEILVKEIRENFYKDVFEVNGDRVEKVERDGKRIYYVVEESKLKTLPAGTKVVMKNGTYRVPTEIGYVLMDDTDIDNQRIVTVRKFKSEDHKTEAEAIVRGRSKKSPEIE